MGWACEVCVFMEPEHPDDRPFICRFIDNAEPGEDKRQAEAYRDEEAGAPVYCPGFSDGARW